MTQSDSQITHTLCFLIKDSKVLLAMKKRGFGEGKWNGVGGKVKVGESIEEAALREAEEEIGIKGKDLSRVATIKFIVPHKPDWCHHVAVFLIKNWEGEPTESEEMAPQWFNFDDIPFESMWDDDKYWLLKVLQGEKFTGSFIFDENQKVKKHKILDKTF